MSYDPLWPQEYQQVRKLLAGLVPGARLEHIGSTSVPGCASKPVIDVSVGLRTGGSLHVDDARAAGLEFRLVRPGSVVFRIQGKGGVTRAFVHVRAKGSDAERRDLMFRDYLSTHPRAVSEYSRLKVRLARTKRIRGEYSAAKAPFVEKTLKAARRWSERTGRKGGT